MTISQKVRVGRAMNEFAEKKVLDAIQILGKALPASVVKNDNSIVTVNFEVQSDFTLPQVTIPLYGCEYVRYPIKAGDLGIVIPADVYIGGVSGQGGGVASLTTPANLSALVFLPISNTEWSNVDITTVTVYAPNGVILRDQDSNTIFTLTPNSIAMVAPNSITATSGGTVMTLSPSGWSITGTTGQLSDGTAHTSPAIMNAAWAAMVTWLNSHTHTSASPGSPTTPPIVSFTGTSIAPS